MQSCCISRVRVWAIWLTNFCQESMETKGGICHQEENGSFLRLVTHPVFQSGIGEDMGIHRTTACKTINYIMNYIIQNRVAGFISLCGKNISVVEAFDCTHIKIRKLTNFGDEYINRKGFVSINVPSNL